MESYVRAALLGTRQCEAQISEAFQNLLDPDSDRTLVRFSFCPWLNISSCDVSEKAQNYYLIVYNPYSKPLKSYARLPVEHPGYQVLEQPPRAVPLQIAPVDDGTLRIPERRSIARQSLVFPVYIPPMGIKVYKVEAIEEGLRDSADSVLLPVDLDEYSIENEYYRLVVDPTKGVVSTVVLKHLNVQLPFRQSIWKYYAYQYSMSWSEEKPSGAYAFNPYEDNPVDMARKVPFRIVKGALVEEIHQVFDSWATQVIRLYRNDERIEFDWTVGPIPFELRGEGKMPFVWLTLPSGICKAGANGGRSSFYRCRRPSMRKGAFGREKRMDRVKSVSLSRKIGTLSGAKCKASTTLCGLTNSGDRVVESPMATLSVQTADVRRQSAHRPPLPPPLPPPQRTTASTSGRRVNAAATFLRALQKSLWNFTISIERAVDEKGSFGKEIVLRFESNLINNGRFFTDSNGRQDIKRVRDAKHPWRYNMTEPIAGNYYPVVSWIHLQDKHKNLQMTAIPDRPQGGSSLKDGMIELMVHRRLQYDDGFGVEEPLDELGIDRQGLIAKGKIFIYIDEIANAQRRMKHLANEQVYRPVMSFLRLRSNDGQHVAEMRNPTFTGLARLLPDGLHIISVEPLPDRRLLVRLEHLHDSGPPITVDLTRLFTSIQVYSAEETVLSANQYLDDSLPFRWSTSEPNESRPRPSETNLQKELRPGDLRTFLLTTSY
ncbi:lysosomal alpha-mannosidase-like [Tropilaelaps mercedesae]|uniref:Lysosomal alpha-mannosidase-like n=1 Tax=Tropilaelaps mercedesae TaxID=418985 RepID=A0A1V9XHV5_9ACAR|nr:lysosomal alpha-mannosidase-like [Tropilaelaps mercedesae]